MTDPFKDNATSSAKDGHFLDEISAAFESGAKNMMEALNLAQSNLELNPSDPSVLASYQAKLQEYTLFRNAQTSTIKAYKDIAAAIIQNFR
ncbi:MULTISPECIES: type III secretion system needle filament subunit SctF [Erwinia]|uniref:Type III secretion system needle filament subunit SctF n=1 Tax=Erwinia pyrifoliae TaxID=79967 RepID=A0ABY5X3D8_ERWPY|nr:MULTISPECIES: type III secretion system needle filament subunit SctF [Erwinia]ADP12403.1 Type III secretion needle MxiH like protein [Erwinia sp. Ejp617]AUX72529.1 EscF/YscF/HrpA family type III secretion system needle major subunit [Erwinia pyrifoliae]MCA8877217.1 EscF/YscF/HrpA family type III secretion system needle major subunit [Erwinia pyrifoliae]MCT2387400.1 type III secretion system needle filament subunit SctF [Erwinia pyrifoliae]MCU8587000.1 type III secretion system needle filame